ncbi:hypothetical protein PG984_002566 [Apiospora sp. TS-2023a]
MQSTDIEKQPDVAVGPHYSSSTPRPTTTDSGNDNQADFLSSTTPHKQPAEMSSLHLTKTMGTSELPAHCPVDEAPPPPQQIDTVGDPDVGKPPVDSVTQPYHSAAQLEAMGPGEQQTDVVGPPVDALLPPPPPPPPHYHSVVRGPSGQDRASTALRSLLRPSPSSPTPREDMQLQAPSLNQDKSMRRKQQPSNAEHMLLKSEAPNSRLPPMGTFKAPPALRPTKDKSPTQPKTRDRFSDKAVFPEKGVSSRKRLPTRSK